MKEAETDRYSKDRYEVAVWGLGAIGSETFRALVAAGSFVVGIDVDSRVTSALARRMGGRSEDQRWVVTTDPSVLQDLVISAHVICVPTESEGAPDDAPLIDVMTKISEWLNLLGDRLVSSPLVIVESTVLPSWLIDIVETTLETAGRLRDQPVHIVAAPRRDWVTTGEWNLQNAPRVIGGNTTEATERARMLLERVSSDLIIAPDHRHAAMTKIVENCLRYLDVSFANELARVGEGFDVRALLELAGTKWNIETYFPSLGIGGYCLPLAPRYLRAELAEDATELHMVDVALGAESRNIELVTEMVRSLAGVRSVVIIGIGYAAEAKAVQNSPGVSLGKVLDHSGYSVRYWDPLFSSHEIQECAGEPVFDLASELSAGDIVVVTVNHEAIRSLDRWFLSDALRSTVVSDCSGAWRAHDLSSEGISYRLLGTPGWRSAGSSSES